MRPSRAVVALLLAVAALSPGCGGDNGEPEAAVEDSPVLGTYTTTLDEETVANPPDPAVQTPSGEWSLEIMQEAATLTDPTGIAFPPGDPVEISEEQIVFAPDPECPVQEGTPGDGTYEWSLDGSELTLTEVEDTCRDRAFLLTAQPWDKTE